ncbi:hypothetical protein C8Q78DRAFT_1083984 [Trametes maxima]|nr:hypothetical protein C8Q78DRAFT_1083984 [Trametes maxima]
MPLTQKSRMVLLSIFKGEPHARCKFDWTAFNKAMIELGFHSIERDGVVFRYRVPAQWGGGTLVLHMDHKVEKSEQNSLKTCLFHAFGWNKEMLLDGLLV